MKSKFFIQAVLIGKIKRYTEILKIADKNTRQPKCGKCCMGMMMNCNTHFYNSLFYIGKAYKTGQRLFPGLKEKELPRYILVSDFERFHLCKVL